MIILDNITQFLLNTPEYQQAKKVHIYKSLKSEPDTGQIITDLKKNNKEIYYPHDNPYRNETDIDLVIVPGTKFDRHMNRKGRGKGYYDMFLEKTSAIKVGLTFSKNIVERLFTNFWDIPMDIIISEKEIIKGE
tara:strand:- start:191 stop:592 length:402 start_codon:yes stop_codon:yes gene_type:complete